MNPVLGTLGQSLELTYKLERRQPPSQQDIAVESLGLEVQQT